MGKITTKDGRSLKSFFMDDKEYQDFKVCCSIMGTNMADVINSLVRSYTIENKDKVIDYLKSKK